jgi:hypothetical protein
VRGATGKASEDVSHSNTHAPDARAAAALVGFYGDALEKLHRLIVLANTREIKQGPCGLRSAIWPAVAIVILCSSASRRGRHCASSGYASEIPGICRARSS